MQVLSSSPDGRPIPHGGPDRFSSPLVFLWAMLVFLALAGFVAMILGRQVIQAFSTNPGLNGLILGVLAVGILLALLQILRLAREARWLNALRDNDRERRARAPVLLAPMEAMVGHGAMPSSLPASSVRAILDSVGGRLDESRDVSRYLVGLLVFLGLLGTFWGLLTTIGSISSTIQSLDPAAGDAATVLDSVKSGLSAPLSGMGTAFSSSLFGLSGSLVLGFLDLQVGRAQNRFYTELEDWLATVAVEGGLPMPAIVAPEGAAVGSSGEEFRLLSDRINRLVLEHSTSPRTSAAMANLAESIQGLVQHMRGEQQTLRDFVEAQANEQREMRRVLERLNRSLSEIERN
ncbi:flagellar motor protein MotA [Aureimonas flava]|uniref:Flagellar motor protein MotA n=1 Tax=Aureimonas flava TaxID=2320271 RepID=A0A3A1WMG8_9HYPH|nr:flagellar motor protein MotA [Aureimonas flava]RIY00927.1 flagellar motor protein MotA [Aureimonas flava]